MVSGETAMESLLGECAERDSQREDWGEPFPERGELRAYLKFPPRPAVISSFGGRPSQRESDSILPLGGSDAVAAGEGLIGNDEVLRGLSSCRHRAYSLDGS